MIVVSDTSAILNLAKVNRLEILRDLYETVLMPPAVSRELAPTVIMETIPWLVVAVPKDASHVRELRLSLDAGESEAIVLALECNADLLLIDERRGRRIALAGGTPDHRLTRRVGGC